METKKIQLNPALLRISEKTRKNRTPKNSNSITSSERSEKSKLTSANLVKKQILNKIRQNYRNSDKYDDKKGGDTHNDDIPIHTSDFDNSVEYFNNLKKKMSPSKSVDTPPMVPLPPQPIFSAPQAPPVAAAQQQYTEPQFGCLKGGKLPTFRNWQKTQKNPNYYNSFSSSVPINSSYIDFATPSRGAAPPPQNFDFATHSAPQNFENGGVGGGLFYNKPSFVEQPVLSQTTISNINENREQTSDWQKEKERIHQIMKKRKEIENSIDVAQKSIPTRKRKITRRTYQVGKSKIHPKVSVLLSNKTIRSQIMTEKQHYNEIPINEVKQYLQKKGLIKIGSNSPNHVLRSMYENAMLLGDVVNHNKDTLLHNFIKGGEVEN